MQSPGYHLASIPKGKLGELSKIQEEAAEVRDAYQQGAQLMVLVELSDLIGAIQAFRVAKGLEVPSDRVPDCNGPAILPGVCAIADRVASMPPDHAEVPGTLMRLEQEIHGYVRHAHPSISWKDLQIMAQITARAFASGRRS